tara:strand:- start:756 stop:1082 length:327 start_codon:yes stop_codon:yes gene_type:complete
MANIYKNEMFALANTGANLLYTVPSDTRAIIKTLQATNTGANVVVTVTANNLVTSFNTTVENVLSNTASNLLKGPLILQESESLSITAASANVVSGILSVLEINRNEQ